MKLEFSKKLFEDPTQALSKEWLETNGLGGWASSSLTFANTRRYHGLLVAATSPPTGRMVMLSKLDETIVDGDSRTELSTNVYPDVLHPRGYERIKNFKKETFPEWVFEVDGRLIRKTVSAIWGENTTVVGYELLCAGSRSAIGGLTLELRPFIVARDYHSLTHANSAIEQQAVFVNGILECHPYSGVPGIRIRCVSGDEPASYRSDPSWYYNFEYERERERGLEHREDLFTPGLLSIPLREGETVWVECSCELPSVVAPDRDITEIVAREALRRLALIPYDWRNESALKILCQAADQFIVKRSSDLRTLLAGYHWFTDWGRDTMIALPGICLVTGRLAEAKMILALFAGHVDRGMLPNRFPDGVSDTGETAEYNTSDATLWYFIAVLKYLEYSEDEAFVKETLFPVLRDIIAWHEHGTRYGIQVDPSDGLLIQGEPGVQLTWMDAKVGDWVVTPRIGKAVEINALWYNAISTMALLAERFGELNEAAHYKKKAENIRTRFREVFWNSAASCLYDVVRGEEIDESIRPNQLFALSLPFPLLAQKDGADVLKLITDELFTPVGLRSLSPRHPDFKPRYLGSQWQRDGAYHQGTVWTWLIGPYITAVCRYDRDGGKARSAAIFQRVTQELLVAGVGQLSEIYDGEAPHNPCGCIAQAWSVGELLRAYVEDISAE